jgi:molybdopterin-binding protein
LSARNRLWGFIDEVRVDGLLAQVRLRVGNQALTAVITADAVRALKLRRGEDAIAIVKSTEMIDCASKQSPETQLRRARNLTKHMWLRLSVAAARRSRMKGVVSESSDHADLLIQRKSAVQETAVHRRDSGRGD